MSRADTPSDSEEPRGAERIYNDHPEACDEFAERDDRVGAVFQAIRDIATEEDADAE